MSEQLDIITPRVEISTIASGSEAGSSPEDEGSKVPGQRQASKSKLLVRSHAIREATSPPPDSLRSHSSNEQRSPHSACATPEDERRPTRSRDDLPAYHNDYHPPWKTTRAQVPRFRLKHQGSSQDSNSSLLSSMSRDPSQESPYTDNTGIDLQQFIVETLHRNQKDRLALMKMEQEMIALVKDPKRTHHKFPPMSSYHRMLVHRVGAYFGLEHNVDQSGNAVIVNKTRGTRIPDPPFRELIRENIPFTDSQLSRKSILKRDSSSFEDSGTGRSPNRQLSLESRSGKSFEDRETDYERNRARNFDKNRSWSSCDAGVIEDYAASPVEHEEYQQFYDEQHLVWRLGAVDIGKQKHRHTEFDERSGRLLKVESLDSHETHTSRLRPAVSKSYSFGGYTGQTGQMLDPAGKQKTQTLLKQDSDGSSASVSRLSPTSSGYKSSHPSDGSTGVSANTSPTPTTSGKSRRIFEPRQSKLTADGSELRETSEEDVPFVLWAISSLDSVPEGSVLISPATGKPFVNSDGSLYRYDSQRPLPFPAAFRSSTSAEVNEVPVQNGTAPLPPGFRSLPTSPDGFQPEREGEHNLVQAASENGYYQSYMPAAGFVPNGSAYVAVQAMPMPANAATVRLVDQNSGMPTGYAFLVPGYPKFRPGTAHGFAPYCEERQGDMNGQGHIQQVSVTSNGSLVCFTTSPADVLAQTPQAVVFPSYPVPGQGYEQVEQQQYSQAEGMLQRPTHLPVQAASMQPSAGYVFPGNQGILASNPFIRTAAPHYRPVMPQFIRPRVPQHSISYSQPGPSGVYYPSAPFNGSHFKFRRPVKANTVDLRPECDTNGQQGTS